MTVFRTAVGACSIASALAGLSSATAYGDAYAQLGEVPVVASPTCGGTVSAEAQVAQLQLSNNVEPAVRVAIHYDAGVYDGSCSLTVSAHWVNLDTEASGSGEITAISTIDGHYGFIGYANKTFATGPGTVVVTLSSHPGAELRITT